MVLHRTGSVFKTLQAFQWGLLAVGFGAALTLLVGSAVPRGTLGLQPLSVILPLCPVNALDLSLHLPPAPIT